MSPHALDIVMNIEIRQRALITAAATRMLSDANGSVLQICSTSLVPDIATIGKRCRHASVSAPKIHWLLAVIGIAPIICLQSRVTCTAHIINLRPNASPYAHCTQICRAARGFAQIVCQPASAVGIVLSTRNILNVKRTVHPILVSLNVRGSVQTISDWTYVATTVPATSLLLLASITAK
jgi:hypothetical protein